MSRNNVEVDKDKLEIRMSRVFDASRERLWQAHSDAKQVEKWWGPRKYTVEVEELDFRIGGKWKFINVDKDNDERYIFYGEYLKIEEPEKITWTFTYEPYPEAVTTETVTFEELPDGKTKLSTVSKFPNIESLDGMVQSGMEEGATETWDRLEELISEKE
jgi:uncharacterized protein YndB with AHSA1/START domain